MNISNFYELLNGNLKDGDIIVPDGGGSYFYPMQMIQCRRDMRFVVSGYGTMGWSLPAAIGAWFANQKARVICIIGDGGWQLNMQEWATVMHHHIPLKVFYMNNGGYQTIHDTQWRYFQRFIGCNHNTGISFPPIDEIIHAYDMTIYTQDIDEAFKCLMPVLCEVKLD